MVAIILLGVLMVFLGILGYLFKSTSAQTSTEDEEEDFDARPARGANRLQAGLRRRRAGARNAAANSDDDDDAGDDNAERQHAGDDDNAKPTSRRDAYEARRAAKDAEREAQEAAQEEEIKRAAEERARREQEEAEKWKHTFTVEAAGNESISEEEEKKLLERMTEYIQNRKMVALEELGAEFNMRTLEVVKKVEYLEAEGKITGVMDDRGKFIYVSRDEMKAVAEYIRKNGRILISKLAMKSSELIDLEPKESVEGKQMIDLDVDFDFGNGQ